MRQIPKQLKEEMANDKYYEKCCLSHLGGCIGRIEWHHSIIYAGKQLNEKFAILPACKYHHTNVSTFNDNFLHIALQRATDDELRAISKAIPYLKLKETLNIIYG